MQSQASRRRVDVDGRANRSRQRKLRLGLLGRRDYYTVSVPR